MSDPVSLMAAPAARRSASRFAGPVVVLVAMLCAAALPSAHAAPFVPSSDSEVVERLPTRWGSSEQRRGEQQARLRLRSDPMQLSLALPLARDAIERARRLGDPRELGQAQAALAPWWGQPSPPPSVRLMRATVLQSQHQFDAALADLDALVDASPTVAATDVPPSVRAQAELTRSAVLQVLGRWPEAEAGCARLASDRYAALGPAFQTPAKACLAELASLQGKAPQASRLLADLSRQHRDGQDSQTQAWLFLLRAELAERQGASKEAQALYRQAMGQGAEQASVYTLVAYADWLLDHGREREVPALLAGREEADAALLRLAIAWQRLKNPRAAEAAAQLAQRFTEATLRGDNSHRREQARYELDVRGNAAAALVHAQVNWAAQKEPADAVLLARCALVAQQRAAAEPLREWMRTTGYQDARLRDIASPESTRKGKS